MAKNFDPATLDLKQAYLVLSHASSHQSSKHIVDPAEDGRIRSLLDCDDKLAFVENVRTCGSVNHQG